MKPRGITHTKSPARTLGQLRGRTWDQVTAGGYSRKGFLFHGDWEKTTLHGKKETRQRDLARWENTTAGQYSHCGRTKEKETTP